MRQIAILLIKYSDPCLAIATVLAVTVLVWWVREEVYKWGIWKKHKLRRK